MIVTETAGREQGGFDPRTHPLHAGSHIGRWTHRPSATPTPSPPQWTPRCKIKGLPQAADAAGVFYPGERSSAVAVERERSGVPVSPKVWRELQEKAEKSGITPPQAGTAG